MESLTCSGCNHSKLTLFADLGIQPAANDLLDTPGTARNYPLQAYVCNKCFLVQLGHFMDEKTIFNEQYPYLSSHNPQTVNSAKQYVKAINEEFKPSSWMEIASNDGYLLQFVRDLTIPCIGIEPAAVVACKATQKGINVYPEFFNEAIARREGFQFDVITANNVLAHVPFIHDFIKGVKLCLTNNGIATFEFPWLLDLIRQCRFDTIYHEHFYYLSILALKPILERHGLQIFRANVLPNHGTSLRVFVCHENARIIEDTVNFILSVEKDWAMDKIHKYEGFQQAINNKRDKIYKMIKNMVSVAGYGAAAKTTVLLNYCGITKEMLPYVVDQNPNKQGKFIPGVNIPIVNIEHMKKDDPLYAVIFPWNIGSEITELLKKEIPGCQTTLI